MWLITSAALSAPRSDSDASCSPATQPSVELRRSVTSAVCSASPATSTRNDRASATSKHSAAASISLSSSQTRSRLSGKPDRDLLVITTCRLSQPYLSRKSIVSITLAEVTRCQSSTMTAICWPPSATWLISDVSTYRSAFSPRSSSTSPRSPLTVGSARRIASSRFAKNHTGLLSLSSTANQATFTPSRASSSPHWAASVVFPYPVGA